MNWKPVLYEYVRVANERETDYGAGAEALPAAERARRLRVRDGREQRGAIPLGSDTTLALRNVREGERETVVDIELRKTVYVRTRGIEHAEERIDRERVTLQRTPGAEWVVVRAEPIVQERQAGGGPSAVYGSGEAAVRAAPFLNERLLARPASDGASERSYTYDREAARAYADRHWNEPNPQFIHFDVDCTNYVSQCLYAGGAPMNYTGVRESGWWYKGKSGGREQWSYSWSVAHALHWYLMGRRSGGLRAEQVGAAGELTIGDVICYDFDGDGRFEHSVIVTGADGAGQPLVNAHTANSRGRYWDYKESPAWTERTAYRFFRIRDGG
ncbi:amidase domain-containing protein [Paenibacillus sp. TRM 82003]|nr:amidase domain-containing protein [Paenibacillus sp. TRM 82003]